MRWPVVGLVALLAACAPVLGQQHSALLPPQSAQERAVAGAVASSWSAARLRAPRATCRLLGLRIETPRTDAAYLERCPVRVYGRSVACLRWREMTPVAIVSPGVARTPTLVAFQALHELIHAYAFCSGVTGTADYYDSAHRLAALWADVKQTRFNSVEQRAQRVFKPPERARVAPAPQRDE